MNTQKLLDAYLAALVGGAPLCTPWSMPNHIWDYLQLLKQSLKDSQHTV